MKVEKVEPSEETETPAGFPGGDRAPLDVEEDRMSRALSLLEEAPEPETTEEAPAEAEEPEESTTEETSEEPAEEPVPEPEAEAKPEPAEPVPDLSGALSKIEEMRSTLEARLTDLDAREEKIRKFESFAKKAEGEHFLDALGELGWDADRVTRAIVEGRGIRSPKDETREIVDEVRSELRAELDALKAVQAERAAAETAAGIARELASGEDRAPLIAAFGDAGMKAVKQQLESAKKNGQQRVNGDQAIRSAIDAVEAELSERFLKVALESSSVRKKYATLLGISDSPAPVTKKGRPLSNRTTTEVARRAETETLTEEQRMARALSHLE